MRAVLELQARKRLGPVVAEYRQAVDLEALPDVNQTVRVAGIDYTVTGVVWELFGGGARGGKAELQPRVYAERQVS